MKPTRIIEICANSAQSCVEAEAGGAKRVELVPEFRKGERHPATGRSGRRRHSLRLSI